ncbi:TonB-dependent receptor [Parabacteroides sp. Marseille-P3160]|uniref:SusC/RagA family TonB-linked outer membrane protein n=1 Tax=Parabacteroides sp. Marseille-P3160 TaxID=1917887 RepID=UPI0009BB6CC2|nr:TonB-dependent receptor [Parabacteroides sp. Marseille-P3160]
MKKKLSFRSLKRLTILLLLTLIPGFNQSLFAGITEVNQVEQQTYRITGSVHSKKGESLLGATVVVKGTTNGTSADLDGNFSLTVSKGDILEISYLGYKTHSEPVNGKTSFNIILEEDSGLLEEVVVVGYGTQKKINMTGSVTTVNFTDKIEGRPVMNASSALAGLSAGLQVMQTSSKPGDDGATLRVRGTTTINNSNPLVLIDGFEADMNNVNTNDIESISILKDASATAIYGSRAANGVILVTTKKGSGKARVAFNSFVSFQKPVNKLSFVTDYADHMEYVNEAARNIGSSMPYSDTSIALWRDAKQNPDALNEYGVPNRIAYPNTDWFDEVFNAGMAQEYNLSVQGGTDNLNYLISAGYLNNEGIMDDSGLEKFQFRTNLEAKVYKWWKLGTRLFGLKQEKGLGNISRGFEYLSLSVPGIYPGSPNKWGAPALTNEESSNANNVFEKMVREGQDKMFRANATLYSVITLFDGFDFEASYNYAPDWGDYSSWGVEKGMWNYVENVRRNSSALENENISYSSFKRARHTADLLLRYNTTIKKDHEIGGLLGYNQSYYNENEFAASKKGMTDWDLHVLNSGVNLNSISGSETDWSLRSLFGRVNYAYKSKYLFEGNLRYDESSRFGPDKRSGYFPSFSAGWRMMEEPFMQRFSHIFQNLKLRASWGEVGNNQLGNYDWQAGYGTTNVVIDGEPGKGLIMNKSSNPLLHWESVATTDIGLDLSTLDNRLSAEIDYYNKHTSGMIFTPDNYLTGGTIAAATQNIAELTNRGVEVTLNWQDKISDFSYQISGNFSYNKNVVDKYRGKLEKGWVIDESGNSVYVNNIGDVARGGFGGQILEGHMLGETYLRSLYRGNGSYSGTGTPDINAGPKDGMVRTENDLKWVQAMQAAGYKFSPTNNVSKTGIWYGDFIYADRNEDGTYGDSNDMDFTGNSQLPKYNFGLNLSAAYKGFDLSMVWIGSAGFKRYWYQGGYNSPSIGLGAGVPKKFAENAYRWDPNDPDNPNSNPYGSNPRLTFGTAGVNGVSSEFWEYDASFVKLRNIQIGYTVPSKISKKALMNRVRIYVSGENLLTLTDYPGMDPEIGSNVSYPLMKQFAFGLNVTF